MARQIDYSQSIADIGPAASPNGELLVAAGKSRGNAAAIEGQSNAATTLFAGNLAIEAGKGYLEAQTSKEIKETLGNLVTDNYVGDNQKRQMEASVPNMQASVLAANTLAENASNPITGTDVFDYNEGGRGTGTNLEIAAMRGEAARYASAATQGAITRDQAIAQIAATVKKYSALTPGFAGEFRKIGAELTGISNVDSYGVHKALTAESNSEKERQKQADIERQLTKEYMSTYGLTKFSEVTQGGLAMYRSRKGLEQFTNEQENKKKLGDMGQEEMDKTNDRIASGYIGQAVAGVAEKFAQLHAANLESNSPEKAEIARRLGGQISAELQLAQTQLENQLGGLTTGQNPWSRARADKVIGELRSVFKNYQEAVSTSEGFNFWNQQVKASKGNLQHFTDSLMLANPHMVVLKETGVMPELAKAWFALGGDNKQFASRFGQAAANTMDRIMKEPKNYADTFGRVATGQESIAEVVAKNPELGKVVYNDVVKSAQKLIEEGGVLRNEQKATFGNLMNAYLVQMDHTKPAELKKFRELMFNPNMTRLFDQLDPVQRSAAISPLLAKLDTTVPAAITEIRSLIEKNNSSPIAKQSGITFDIGFDSVAGLFRAEINRSKPAKELPSYVGPGGAVFAVGGFTNTRLPPEQKDAHDTINQRLTFLNMLPHVLASTLPLVGKDKPDTDVVFEQLNQGLNEGRLRNGLLDNKALREAATNAPTPIAAKPDWAAITAAGRAQQPARDLEAARIRKAEGVTQADVAELEKALKSKGLGGTARTILQYELKLNKMALELP